MLTINMKISTVKINKKDLITMPEVPQGTASCAVITYRGMSILVPEEILYNGLYRMEFIKEYGIPLPTTILPKKIKRTFSPNLKLVIE
jgi:hypothetical protein